MLPDTRHPTPDTAITLWLSLCLLLIGAMVVIGGYTRLSGSGLSITSWKPIHGTIPPMSDTDWQEEFTAYQASPQYQKVNNGMTLNEFQTIFWPEFIHRLLGRLIGAVFFLPLIVFYLRGSLSRRSFWRLMGIFALGGLQGLIGWLMVKSGLVDTPQVSPIRLAMHLSTAFAVFGLVEWTLLEVVTSKRFLLETGDWRLETYFLWFTLLCLQIIMGAFMAGLHGGLIYNTWPTMNGQWIPDGLSASPWYGNIAFIQFIHRNLAILVALLFPSWWYLNRNYLSTVVENSRICKVISLVLGIQVTLGIMTLLHQAPLVLALAHQVTGLLLFAAAVVLLHRIYGIHKTL